MFSPAARAGTYNAPASAHDATTKYSTRFMRIAISISPAVSRRRPSVLASSRAEQWLCEAVGTAQTGRGNQTGDFLEKCIIYPSTRPVIQKYFLKSDTHRA